MSGGGDSELLLNCGVRIFKRRDRAWHDERLFALAAMAPRDNLSGADSPSPDDISKGSSKLLAPSIFFSLD